MSYEKKDNFSTFLKGFAYGRFLIGLYLIPAFLLIYLAANTNINFILLMIIFVLSYIFITIFLIIFFKYFNRKKMGDKFKLRDDEDKLFREYFRKKEN